MERLAAGVLERLATARWTRATAQGRSTPPAGAWELDPLDEAGQRRLIELMARSGDRAGAIGRYRTLVALFDRELGVPPLRETTELYESVREGTLSTEAAASWASPHPGSGFRPWRRRSRCRSSGARPSWSCSFAPGAAR